MIRERVDAVHSAHFNRFSFCFFPCFNGYRRDSFITHRAFCDVLVEESERAITTNPFLSSHLPNSLASNYLNLPPQLPTHGLQPLPVKRDQYLIYHQNHNHNPNSNALAEFQCHTNSPHMSSTALLQKAAEMGVTMSKSSPLSAAMLRPHQAHMYENTGSASTAGSGLGLSSREELGSGFVHSSASFGNKAAFNAGYIEQFAACSSATGAGGEASPSLLHDMMSYLSSTNAFNEGLSGYNNLHETVSRTTESRIRQNDHEKKDSDGLPRDFLSLKAFPHKNSFIDITGLDCVNSSSPSSTYERHNQNQIPWQG